MYFTRFLNNIRPNGTRRFIQLHSRDRHIFDEWVRENYRTRITGYSVTSAITGIASYNAITTTNPEHTNSIHPRYHTLVQLGVGTLSAVLWPFFLPTNFVFLTAMFINDFNSKDPKPTNHQSL
jgi:hypothetical protein